MRQRHEVFGTRAKRGRGRRLLGTVLSISALMVGGLAGFGPDRATAQALGSLANAVTVAGGNGVGNGANQFHNPAAVAIDSAGNMYVADLFNHRVQKWVPGAATGTTAAGGIVPGPANNQLNEPISIAVQGAEMYLSDRRNHRIQKWTIGATSGQTAAGGAEGGDPNQLNLPNGVAFDSLGNLLISDSSNSRIQRWDVGAYSGTTIAGGSGLGGANSQFNVTRMFAVDSADNVYVSDDLNHRIQKWAPGATEGVTVAGGHGPGSDANQLNRPQAVVLDKAGNIYVSDMLNHRVQRWAPGATSGVTVLGGNNAGIAANQLNWPGGLHLDRFGNLLVADSTNDRIQKINVDTTAPTTLGSVAAIPSEVTGIGGSAVVGVVGYDDFSIVKAEFFEGATLVGTDTTADPGGLFSLVVTPTTFGVHTYTVVLTDGAGNTVTSAPGTLTVRPALGSPTNAVTVAGGNGPGAGASQFNRPWDVATDEEGNMYVADYDNYRIQRWVPGASTGSTVAGGNGQGTASNQFLGLPIGVSVRGRDLYISEYSRVQKWTIGELSGQTVAGGNGIGIAPNQLSAPRGVDFDSFGSLLVSDNGNDRVQRWASGASSGTTVAGGNGQGSAPNQFSFVGALAVDAADSVYVPDILGNRVQKWTAGASAGVTVAGGKGAGSGADQLVSPAAIVLDKTGNMYVSDTRNNRVQRWAPGASSGVTVLGGNSAGAAPNQLNYPTGLDLDRFGNLLVADTNNNRIQKINLDTAAPTSGALTTTPSVLTGVGGSSTLGVIGTDDFAIAKAEFFEGATLLGTDTTPDPGGLFSFVVTPTTIGVHTYTAVLTDGAGNTVTSAPGTLTVNAALTPPVFTASTPPTTATVGVPYSYTFVASGNPTPSYVLPITFGSTPPVGLTFDNATGVLSGTPLQAGVRTFFVVATNSEGSVNSGPITIAVSAAPVVPVFTASSPSLTGTVGSPYSYTFAASGNPAPDFSVASGVLPAGLSLTAAGVLSGSPTTAGSSTFVVRASSSAGTVSAGPFTIAVSSAPVAPTFTAATPTPATVGSAYSYTFTASGQPAPTFGLAAGSVLPAGLTLTSTGVLSGTPTAAGSSTFEVLATNTAGTVSTFATVVVSPVVATPADLRVKIEGPASVRIGQTIKYEVDVINTSATTAVAGPIVVTYTLPAGTSFGGTEGSGWTCVLAGNVLTCTRASGLAALAKVELKIRVLIGATAATLTHTVSVTPLDVNPANNTASVVSRVRR
jgi:uncharacterized repeat protein (TIGR01451 family)